jgi:hypothetical protein
MTELLITQLIALLIAVFLAVYFFAANLLLRKSLVEAKRREKRLTASLNSWQNALLRKVGAGQLKPASPREKDETTAPVRRIIAPSQAIAETKAKLKDAPIVPKSVEHDALTAANEIFSR